MCIAEIKQVAFGTYISTLITVLNQINSISILLSYFFIINLNIILPSMPVSPKWFRPFRSTTMLEQQQQSLMSVPSTSDLPVFALSDQYFASKYCIINLSISRYVDLTAVVMKSSFICDIRPCFPFNVNLRFGEIYRLHLQGSKVNQPGNKHESGSRCSCIFTYFQAAFAFIPTYM
jgi:hypothetical protein